MGKGEKAREHDFSVTAFRVVQEATGGGRESIPEVPTSVQGKNPHAVALGSLGGKKGGPVRAARLTAARRSEIARQAAEARWRKQ